MFWTIVSKHAVHPGLKGMAKQLTPLDVRKQKSRYSGPQLAFFFTF